MIADPKSFKPSAEMISAAETVLLAMAQVGVVKPVVEAYQREILARHRWTADPLIAEEEEVILEPRLSYMLPPKALAVYHAECNQAREAAGLFVEEPEFCPALVAEEDLRQARRAMVDLLKPITGVDSKMILGQGMKSYQEYVDLTLKLLSPFCDAKGRLDAIRDEGLVGAAEGAERPRA